MSKHEDNLKKQLDDLLSSREFPFEQPAWEKMEGLLDEKKRKRRILYFFWTGLGAGLVSVTAWFLFNSQDASSSSQIVTKLPQRATADQQDLLNTRPEIQTDKSISEQHTPIPDSKPRTKIEKPEIKSLNKPSPELPADPASAPFINKDTKQVNWTETDKDESVKTATPPTNSTVKPVPSETVVHTTVPEQSTSSAENIAAVATPLTLAEDPHKNLEAPVLKEVVAEEKTPSVPKDTLTTIQPLPLANAPDTVLSVKAAKPDTDYVHRKQVDLRLEAGGSWLSGWMDEGRRDGAGINPLTGIHCYLPIGRELQFGIGFQYTQTAHLKYSKYTATVTRLDLGRTVKATEFTPVRLHYLVMPLRLSMRMDDKQSAGIGVNAAYLLTADSKVSEYTEDRNGIRTLQSYKAKGYTEGFSDFDAQLCFFYQRRITGRFRLNTELVLGLRDVKNGQVLKSQGVERNSGIRFSVQYALFENK